MDIQSYEMMVYVERDDKYYPIDNVPEGAEFKKLSGTKLRGLLAEGAPIPVRDRPPLVDANASCCVFFLSSYRL